MNTAAELKVIDRISKLLALSRDTRGATEHEAALAAEKAQELMAEYNIELATVEARGQVSGNEGQREKKTKAHRTVYKWQHDLMNEIAGVNFCVARRQYRRSEKNWRQQVFQGYEVIGRRANVAATEHTFDYLTQTIERLARTWAEENVDPGRPGTSNLYSADACRFREGCADRITHRLRDKRRSIVAAQQRKEREARATSQHPAAAADPSFHAPVVFSDYIQMEDDLNNDLLWGWEPGTTAKRRAEWEAQASEREKERAARPAPDATPETAKERARRERASQRWWESYSRRQSRDAERKASRGYREGQDAGERVGLDQQVSKGDRTKLN